MRITVPQLWAKANLTPAAELFWVRFHTEARRNNEIMFVDIGLDGPPGPESGRFVEVENQRGRSVNVGEWVQRPDGYWALRISPSDITSLESDPTNGHH